MDYEKLYNDALERAKKIKEFNGSKIGDLMEHIFPELRESEDERNERLHNGVIESLICYKAKLYDEGDKEVAAIVDEEINWMRDCWKKQKPVEWSEEDEKMFESALWHVKNSCGNGGKDSGEFEVYNWLKSLKDRVQPKQEWSEEDEKKLDKRASILKIGGNFALSSWLKSLKHRWKPSK